MASGQPSARLQSDEDLVVDNGANQNEPDPLWKQACIIVGISLSPSIGFCWRLMAISFLISYYYARYVFGSVRASSKCRLSSMRMAKFVAKTIVKMVGLAALLGWCISITPVHLFAPTLMDIWTPYNEHDPLRMTEVMYDAGENAVIDVFAIHGLGSSPESAWTYKSNGTAVSWLSDLLPQAKGFQDARVVLINHQTRWDSNTPYMELHDYASELLEHIESQHKANPARPIIFIAHSFGGLLLKKALLLAKSRSKDVAAMTRGIIFLGVPHRGTNAAFAASCLSCMAFFRGSSSNLLQFMAVDSPAVLDLESEFYDAYVLQHHSQQQQPYIYDVLEMRPERMGRLVLGSIVRPKHGLLRHGRVITLDTDHRGLNKFRSSDDPNFQIFLRVLWQTVNNALKGSETSCHKHLVSHPNRLLGYPPEILTPIPEEPQVPLQLPNTAVPAPDILDYASYVVPWTASSRLAAALMSGLGELAASWLAEDCGRTGSYFTSRVVKMVIHTGLISISIEQGLTWILYKLFEGYTALEARILQLIISHFTIVPIQTILDITAMAIIAGARTELQIAATLRVGFRTSLLCSWILSPVFFVLAHKFVSPDIWVPFFSFKSCLVLSIVNTHIKKRRLAVLRKKHFGGY